VVKRVKPLALASVALSSALLASCTFLPRSGPDGDAVIKSAKQHVGSPNGAANLKYTLVDLNADNVRFFSQIEPLTLRSLGSSTRTPPPDIIVGVGDVISVSIFESSAGGLFIPSDAGSRPGNFVTLPSQIVGRSGTITVPYAGVVHAAGKSTISIQRDIERALANRAIEPQVLVGFQSRSSSVVSVLGDVNQPDRFETNPGGDRILDAIAKAGGLSAPDTETTITLQRAGRDAKVSFKELVRNPQENVFVIPGDVVYARRERRTFLALGASGLVGRINFEESNLTLAEAMGQSGGLLDGRANPAQVFLYRLVPVESLRLLGLPLTDPSAVQPVVFRINLRDPAGYFVAQKFQMEDKDILYVSNSDSVELTKFLEILNLVSSTVSGVTGDINGTKNNVSDIAN
jgi:polysaccharide export outer membrane protein